MTQPNQELNLMAWLFAVPRYWFIAAMVFVVLCFIPKIFSAAIATAAIASAIRVHARSRVE